MPDGFWQSLIGYVVDFVGNYGLAIILFSIILKIILSPLDFMQRKITKNNTEKQAKLKPQLDKLNKKYANNKEMLNQKTMELYKKENYNVVGTCLGMFVNLTLTLVIFITLFGAMRDISQFKLANQYSALADTYQITYTQTVGDDNTKLLAAQEAVLNEYETIKDGFLWVSNIWMPDTSASVIPSYSNYLKLANQNSETGPTEQEYNEVMGILQQEYQGWNGYYILIILAGAITYFSQKILQGKQNKKTEESTDAVQMNSNFMLFLLPVLMVVFTIGYSAAFALYIVMNSTMTMFTSFVSNKILEAQKRKQEEVNKLEYSRN